MLICRIPAHYTKFSCVSAISGLLNTFTYVGGALATFGTASLCDKMGWLFTVALWAALALAGTALCVAGLKKWKAFTASTG